MGSLKTTGSFSPASVSPEVARIRISELETALARVRAEQQFQAVAIERELSNLSTIYDSARTDLRARTEERDRAVADMERERDIWARHAEELEDRLRSAQQQRAPAPFPAEQFVADRMASATLSHLELKDGELPQLAGFDILEQLGRGGMAYVFKAKRHEDGKLVALKLLKQGTRASSARTELFLREAALTMQLDHSGMVRAYDAGECAYGRYLVMELIEGESLAVRVRRDGPVSEARAIEVALWVADVLVYCRGFNLVHRDVKPSNLLIQEKDDRVKLCDFGLAALRRDDQGRPYGSPGYASPEQLKTPQHVDERADIYGLGCTLWHLVVGRRPFPGPTNVAFEIQQTTDLPDPRFEGADVSQRLAQVIRKMGRCAPTRRYHRWDECVMDLMLIQKGNPPFAATFSAILHEQKEETVDPVKEASTELESHHRSGPALTSTSLSAPALELDPVPAPDAGPAPRPEAQPDRSSARPGMKPGLADDSEPRPPLEFDPEPPRSPSPVPSAAPSATPPDTPGPALRAFVLAAFVLFAGAVGLAIGASRSPSPADVLERRARALAASGQSVEAAARLREAAGLLPEPDRSRLRKVAAELERR